MSFLPSAFSSFPWPSIYCAPVSESIFLDLVIILTSSFIVHNGDHQRSNFSRQKMDDGLAHDRYKKRSRHTTHPKIFSFHKISTFVHQHVFSRGHTQNISNSVGPDQTQRNSKSGKNMLCLVHNYCFSLKIGQLGRRLRFGADEEIQQTRTFPV